MKGQISSRGETKITELQRRVVDILTQLRAATTQQDSRIILTRRGKPVAVLQDYEAYKELIDWLETTQRALHVAEARERLRQINEGSMGAVPFQKVQATSFSPIAGDRLNVQR